MTLKAKYQILDVLMFTMIAVAVGAAIVAAFCVPLDIHTYNGSPPIWRGQVHFVVMPVMSPTGYMEVKIVPNYYGWR